MPNFKELFKSFRKFFPQLAQPYFYIVWFTKYRYKVLKGDLQVRFREILIEVCEAQGIEILKVVVSSDHVHIHIEYAPKFNVSGIVKNLKGRSSRKLQQEFPSLKKRYWGNHFWAGGYGVWSSGNITDEMVSAYLEHHRRDGSDNSNFILERPGDLKSLAQKPLHF